MPQGYRVVSYDLESLKAETLMDRKPVDLTIGSVHEFQGGLYLGTSLEFTEFYLGNSDGQDVILTFDFDEHEILEGDLSPNSEILVKKGVLTAARFEDEGIQERFGHLLDPSINDKRREIARGQPLSDTMGVKKIAVIRAMDARVGHLQPMDYVYCMDNGAYKTLSKRVLKAYEDGDQVRSPVERSMMKALEHAVTTAIYEGEPQQVSFAVLSNKDVYEAPNGGEFFFDGKQPQAVKPLFKVDENGAVELVKDEVSLEISPDR